AVNPLRTGQETMRKLVHSTGAGVVAALAAGSALAQTATEGAPPADAVAGLPGEAVFILNSLLFLIGGFLVMFMAAGFCMLEAGLVRSKNVTMQCTKNVALFSLAAIA